MDATADADHPPSPTPPKRSPWNHPSSSSSSTTNGVGSHDALIDANNWPALADAATTPKTKYLPPPPPPSDPAPAPAPAPAPPAASSAAANSSNSPKHSSGSHSHHTRHKPARRGGPSGSGSNGNGGGDHSPRDHPDRTNASWGDHGSSAGAGRGGAAQRNHSNGGGGGRRGGGGAGGFGGRRRGGYDGGFYRGPPMGIGPYMRGTPPPPPPSYMGPPPPPVSSMRPFPGPMLFHDMQSPVVSPVSPMYYVGPPPPLEAIRGFAFAPTMVSPPLYPYSPASPLSPEPDAEAEAKERRAKLLTQMEFYFSKDNLCTDVYLRRNMDDQGWVNLALIATFKKVRETTEDLEYIKETIQSSSILEIQDEKIRRKDDWNKWVIPRESNPDMPSNSAVATSSNINNLSAHLGGVSLHESAASSSSTVDENHHEALLNGSTSNNGKAPVVEDNAGHH